MDYTLSNSYVADVGTGLRMHLQAQAVPTAVSDNDINQLIWELMEIVRAGGQTGAPFDKATPATYQKLLTALRSPGVFTTPPQFDISTRAATTTFVRLSGLQGSSISSVLASTLLTPAIIGGTLLIATTAATTQTLPAVIATPVGARIEFVNISTGIATVQRSGSELIFVGSSTVDSITLGVGDSLTLASNGINGWVAVGGSVRLRYASAFGSLLGPFGWKRIPDVNSPSGFIIEQWGAVSGVPPGAAGTSYALPIAFPNAVMNLVASHSGATGGSVNVEAAFLSPSAVQITHNNVGPANVMYRALGY